MIKTIKFIEKSINIHGDRYDYSSVEYINSSMKVKIICSEHGVFLISPKHHLYGRGCQICTKNIKTKEKNFIKKSKIIHDNKYDYSLVEYYNNKKKVKIICPEHGIFEQIACNHMNGAGCSKCSGNYKSNTEEFIIKSKEIHGDKYDYSLVEYKNWLDNVKIICPEHGIFEQIPNNHLRGKGCIYCAGNYKSNTEEFIEKSINIHGDKYDYSLVEYENCGTKVKIICNKHGEFLQKPDNHLGGSGCPTCRESKGEIKISNILDDYKIKYERQQKFKGCINIKKLSFDFYLPEYNICIEYDGRQHYEPINEWGGEKEFKNIKIRDNIKTVYCKENDIKLIRISYKENIEDKLECLWSCDT